MISAQETAICEASDLGILQLAPRGVVSLKYAKSLFFPLNPLANILEWD